MWPVRECVLNSSRQLGKIDRLNRLIVNPKSDGEKPPPRALGVASLLGNPSTEVNGNSESAIKGLDSGIVCAKYHFTSRNCAGVRIYGASTLKIKALYAILM